jgi:ABC-type multidrug transport system fused ATPase/permease subunit
MIKLIKENKFLFTITILSSAAVSAAYVFIAMILQTVTDTAVSGDMEGFRRIVVISVVYLLGMGVVSFISSILSKLLICRIVRQLRSHVFSGILRRNMQDFSSVDTADYLSAVTNDIKLVEDNGIQPLLVIVQNAVMFTTAVIILFSINVVIGLCLIGCLILMFAIPMLFGKALSRRQDAVSKKLSAFTTKVKDILSGYEVVKTYGMDNQVRADYETQNRDNALAKFRVDKLIVMNASVSEVLAYITVFSGFFIGAYLILLGEISAGVLLALIQLSSSFVNPLMFVMDGMPKVQGIRPVLNRLEAMTNYEDTAFTGTRNPTFDDDIRLRNVTFAYNENLPVLRGLSLYLLKNKKYAVVGYSGSGKSTLIKLLTGTYAGFNGDIRYDGEDIRSLDIIKLRSMISVIHQNVYMFSGSIRENIILHRSVSDCDLNNAIEQSGVNLFLHDMSAGLDSFTGENGSTLSGGQRQRVAVARALIQKTPVLILDEGTAAIDKQTAYSIESGLLGLNDLTLITITHNLRPELLSQYDQILFMQDGRIIEAGTFEDLLNRRGEFFKFYYLPQDVELTA